MERTIQVTSVTARVVEHFYLLFPDERDIKHSKIFCIYPVIRNTGTLTLYLNRGDAY